MFSNSATRRGEKSGYSEIASSMDSEGIRSTRRYSSNNTSNAVNIDRKQIVNYDHRADKSLEKKYNANYKLRVVDDKILPNYLVKNKNKFKEWFDNSE